jgi:tagaturonate reductase
MESSQRMKNGLANLYQTFATTTQKVISTSLTNASLRMLKKLNRTTTGIAQNRPVKVLQFGGGNFLRGFADWMIDVLNEKTDFNGAVDIITSVTPGTAEQINEQQGLYHLIQQGNKNGKRFFETRLITSVNRAINPAQHFEEFLKCAENPDLRFIISNTTEAGIAFDESDTNIDSLPNSFPGKVTLLLYQRYKHFRGADDKTLVLLPCELIEKNGDKLKDIVIRYTKHWNLPHEFLVWVHKNIFCNTLVDRIVPGFPKETIKDIQNDTGFEDKLTVAAEPFYFWAIEAPSSVQNEFPTKAAGLDDVVFTSDITPYRIRKVRILNGAHTALVPVAFLRGLRTVKDAMDDPQVGKFIQQTIDEEIIPTLSLSRNELIGFSNAVADRFRNPFIKHFLQSIALNSISKFKVRVLPTMLDYIELREKLPENLVTSLAALICFYRGEWKGETIPLNDSPEVIAIFKQAWKEETLEKTVSSILSNTTLWEMDLTKVEGLSRKVSLTIGEF